MWMQDNSTFYRVSKPLCFVCAKRGEEKTVRIIQVILLLLRDLLTSILLRWLGIISWEPYGSHVYRPDHKNTFCKRNHLRSYNALETSKCSRHFLQFPELHIWGSSGANSWETFSMDQSTIFGILQKVKFSISSPKERKFLTSIHIASEFLEDTLCFHEILAVNGDITSRGDFAWRIMIKRARSGYYSHYLKEKSTCVVLTACCKGLQI